MQPITSRAHPFVKKLIKLGNSTNQRKKSGLTLLDGTHLIEAYAATMNQPIHLITSNSGYECAEIRKLAHKHTKKVIILSDSLFREVSPVKTPTGILAVIAIPTINFSINKDNALIILLESIQDPGNLGSILRSAAAADVSNAYLSKDCTDVWSPKVLRAAMGAHFLLNIHERFNLEKIAELFSGKIITTTVQAEKSLYDIQLTGSVAFVFGNEGKGLSDEILRISNEQVKIPMLGGTESLNAASAAAICLFESVRQKIKNKSPAYRHL